MPASSCVPASSSFLPVHFRHSAFLPGSPSEKSTPTRPSPLQRVTEKIAASQPVWMPLSVTTPSSTTPYHVRLVRSVTMMAETDAVLKTNLLVANLAQSRPHPGLRERSLPRLLRMPTPVPFKSVECFASALICMSLFHGYLIQICNSATAISWMWMWMSDVRSWFLFLPQSPP